MKLAYRGVSYESNLPNLEVTEGEIGGKYRGTTWREKYPRHIPVPYPRVDLKYRGVAYSVGDPVDIEAIELPKDYANAETSTTIPATTPASSNQSGRQQVLAELHNTHLQNLRCNLEHRLQVARAKGDSDLIRILEAEARQLAVS